MTDKELFKAWDQVYDLPAGETLEFTSKNGLTYKITKDSIYGDKEAYREMDPELTDEELSDPDFGNLVTVEVYDGDKLILSSDDVHVLDLNVKDVYEDEMKLIDNDENEMTGKEWLSLEEEKEV